MKETSVTSLQRDQTSKVCALNWDSNWQPFGIEDEAPTNWAILARVLFTFLHKHTNPCFFCSNKVNATTVCEQTLKIFVHITSYLVSSNKNSFWNFKTLLICHLFSEVCLNIKLNVFIFSCFLMHIVFNFFNCAYYLQSCAIALYTFYSFPIE